MSTVSLNAPAAVLFDLDGTLVDTAIDFYPVVNSLRAEIGKAPLPDACIREQVSNGGVALATITYDVTRDDPDIQRYRQRVLDRYEEIVGEQATLFEGYSTLLEHLDQRGIPWGIVTNKPRKYTELLLSRMPLPCDYVVCPEDVTHNKPAPDSLLLCAEQMQVVAEQCWYVGDHVRDIQAAKAANMRSIAVRFGYLEAEDDPALWGADHLIDTVDDLLGLLGGKS
ncbi:MAG: phosphoglycolate phosphatase [Pseudomonas sp.]|nr:phosphoglycolate phosphatase [Pseudomonas sp.]